MKTLISIAALGLAAFGFASPACAAWEFSPTNTAFTAKGSLTFTAGAVSLPCTVTLHGTTTGGGKITSASFSGLTCVALTPSDLPWGLSTHTSTGATFHRMSVSALVLGICGPSNVKATVGSTGKITISGAGLSGSIVNCSVSGTLTTNPQITIVKFKK